MVSIESVGDLDARVFQTILALDDRSACVLVDCGWDARLQLDKLDALIEQLPRIDVILLSHATIAHSGAFAYMRHTHPVFRQIPVYATLPVIKMGLATTIDAYRSHGLTGAFSDTDGSRVKLDESEIENIWEEITPIRYSQPLQLHGHPRLESLTIAAYNAGHGLGGTLWKLMDGVDSIIIAEDWNHAQDAHLAGAFIDPGTGRVIRDLSRPSILVTSTMLTQATKPQKASRAALMDNVRGVLKRGGTVLLPTSIGARVLELILVLQAAMKQDGPFPLVFCSYCKGFQMLEQASSMLEWMTASIISDWQVQNESPFGTVDCVSSADELRRKWPRGTAKVVVASGECLESGFAKQYFVDEIAADPDAAVIFTELCPPGSFGAAIMENIRSTEESMAGLIQLTCRVPTTLLVPVALEGQELRDYEHRQAVKREEAELRSAQERRNQELIATAAQEAESSDSESDSEDLVTADPEALGAGILLYGPCDFYMSNSKNTVEMFPLPTKRRRGDDYGELIPPQMFKFVQDEAKKVAAATAAAAAAMAAKVIEEAAAALNEDEPGGSESRGTKGVTNGHATSAQATPMKMVERSTECRVLCWGGFIDLSGLTNLRSMTMVIKQMNPLKLIALPGPMSKSVIDALQPLCSTFVVGDTTICFDRTNFSVDVKIPVDVPIQWRTLKGGYKVARVSGYLKFDAGSRAATLEAALEASDSVSDKAATKTVTVGNLKLTDLRRLLNERGMKAEIRSQGLLVCGSGDEVAVRRSDNGSYTIDGGLTETFYQVRDAVRDFVTTV